LKPFDEDAAMPWDLMPGGATDIGVDAQGTAWVVGTDNEVHRWNEATAGWTKIQLEITPYRISCGNRHPIVSSTTGYIQVYDDQTQTWNTLPGKARDVAGEANTDGTDAFFIVGTSPVGDFGYGIYQWADSAWKQLPGAAWKIGGAINPWITGGDGIYRNISASEWRKMSTDGLDITKYGPHVWKVGPSLGGEPVRGEPYRWDWATSRWIKTGQEKIKAIAVGGNGIPWAVTTDDRILRFRP
jgi:hypothetical protein